MTEIIENLETENIVKEEAPIKKPIGRPRKPEEEKKKYIPHPLPKKEKPIKQPRVKKERHYEEKEPLPKGRKKGQVFKPERYLPDGTYDRKPLDSEYHKKYYREVIRFSGVCVCDICGSTISNKQALYKHKKTQYCKRIQAFKLIPDILPLVTETIHEDYENFNLVTQD